MDQQPTLAAGELVALFKFIPSKQLLKLRQVSKYWDKVAVPILRTRLDLNFTLTRDDSRNWKFWEFLESLPENGFLASVMKLQKNFRNDDLLVDNWKGRSWNLEEGYVYSFPAILIEICKIFGTGNGPIVKKLILDAGITFELLLLMIRHLSPSLEILDMKDGFLKYSYSTEVIPHTHELRLALFSNRFPMGNLQRIEIPKEQFFWINRAPIQLIQWLEILVESAPNLTHDPVSECKMQYGISDDYCVKNALAFEPLSEKYPNGADSVTLDEELSPVQLGIDELELLCKFIPSSQILELRHVSKVWNEAAVVVLRKRHDLKFKLTEDAKRNWDFLKFLRSLPENGFVASEMEVRGVNEKNWSIVDLEEGSVTTPLEIWIKICKIFAAGVKGRAIRKLTLRLGERSTLSYSRDTLTSGMMLLMLRHLSTSLEVLDLEWGFFNCNLKQKSLDEALNIFRNRFPFTKLQMIVPPSNAIFRNPDNEKNFIRWLNVLVQSAPNLTNDPVTECRVDFSDDSDDSDEDFDHFDAD